APYTEEERHPVLLDHQLEEVEEGVVGAVEDLVQAVLLLVRGEEGREQEHLEVAVLGEGVRELAELLADLVELVLLLRDLEERPRVDLGDLFHGPSCAGPPPRAA